MIKKLFCGFMAAAMLFTTSCQQQELTPTLGEEAMVTFNVGTPEIATRAYSDGLSATNLQYAVYDAEGNWLQELTVTDAIINGTANVKIHLTTGKEYTVVFWADNAEAPYNVDFANKKMTVDYTNVTSNNEKMDAFYAYHTFTVDGIQTEKVDLKRPFAQLNIGTSDYEASRLAGYTPTQSSVIVENVYKTLNFDEHATVDDLVEVTFKTANINANETFPVENNYYLAMNYLLVDADKEVVDVVLTHTDGSFTKERTINSVPVQRNYRTNIYGKILTSEVDVNVEIKPGYETPDYTVKSADELVVAINQAIASGEDANIQLDENISLNEPLIFTAPAQTTTLARMTANNAPSFVIDGKGKTIYYGGNDRAIDVKKELKGANITLKDVTVECLSDYCERGINYNTNGTLVLENVIVKGKNVTYALNLPGSSDNAVITINNSSLIGNIALNVWGENSEINATNSNFISVDNTKVENYSAISLNNDGTTVAEGTVVTINGGEITAADENGEPSYAVRNSTATGQVKISETTEVFGTVANPVAIVTYQGYQFYSFTTLQDAIDKAIETKAASVRLIADIELSEPATIAEGGNVTLDLNGKTITGTIAKTVGHVINVAENAQLTMLGGKVQSTAANGGSAICNNGTLTVQGTEIVGASVRENDGWPSYPINNYSNMTLTDVTITGYQGAVACSGAGTTTLNNSVVTKEYLNTSSHVFYINHTDANVIVNGGNYTHKGMDGSLAYVNKGSITVNDGEFSVQGGGYGIAALINGKVVVNGGTFNTGFQNWGGSISILGGTHKVDPNKYLPEGYKAIDISKGVFKVVPQDVNYLDEEITNPEGVIYTGDWFESPMENTLWFNNYIFGGDAAIKVVDTTYGAIIIENSTGNFIHDVITIHNTNNSVMILENLDITLAEGKKLINSVNKIYQVFMVNIKINGEQMTQESIAQYLENVEWYQVVEEIESTL